MQTELPTNTMTIIELEGDALRELLAAAGTSAHTLRIGLEVEPNGDTYVKVKVNEGIWSHPFTPTTGATARAEVLY